MDFDDSAVQPNRLDPDAHDLSMLQLLKHTIEHPILGPAIHARVEGVPIAESQGQPAPFATVLGHVQNRIDYAQIRMADIAALLWQAVLDLAPSACTACPPRCISGQSRQSGLPALYRPPALCGTAARYTARHHGRS